MHLQLLAANNRTLCLSKAYDIDYTSSIMQGLAELSTGLTYSLALPCNSQHCAQKPPHTLFPMLYFF